MKTCKVAEKIFWITSTFRPPPPFAHIQKYSWMLNIFLLGGNNSRLQKWHHVPFITAIFAVVINFLMLGILISITNQRYFFYFSSGTQQTWDVLGALECKFPSAAFVLFLWQLLDRRGKRRTPESMLCHSSPTIRAPAVKRNKTAEIAAYSICPRF